MRHITFGLLLTLLASGCAPAAADSLTERAIDGDGEAISALRALGRVGVERLYAARPAATSATLSSWRQALDTVCAQRDCDTSRLYWFTDLDQALGHARRESKPVLSLRLLGRLDEEVSCANSRFFRTVLYPDPAVRAALEGFVLHWQSVRPVPTVTIDFGDGRTLEGTVTGNSLHLVLDPQGRVVDLLPGLYGAGEFLDQLAAAAGLAAQLGDDTDAVLRLRSFHNGRIADSRALLFDSTSPAQALARAREAAPTALVAGAQALSKAAGELPLLFSLSFASWREQAGDVDWAELAARSPDAWRLSPESRLMVARKHPTSDTAELQRVIDGFERLVGLDTIRNEHLLHPVVRSWLATNPSLVLDHETLVERVYDELFLTPSSDPWLGLRSPETYLALAPGRG